MSAEAVMRGRGWMLAGLALAGCSAEDERADLCLEAGVLIDGTGGPPRTDRRLVVNDGRIVSESALSDRSPRCANRVDATEGWVIPGLFEMHAHVALNLSTEAVPYPPQYDDELSDWSLRALLAWGVTTARDVGGELPPVLEQREAVATGRKPGPELLVTGPFVDGPEVMWGAPLTRKVTNPSDTRQAVRDLAAAGVDGVKLYVDLPPDLVAVAAEEAGALGLFVVGDLRIGWTDLVASGVGSLEHVDNLRAYVGPADSSEAAAAVDGLAGAGVAITPTMFVPYQARTTGADVVPTEVLAWVPDRQEESWLTLLGYFGPGWPEQVDEVAVADRGAWARRLHEAGVPLLVGTDCVYPYMIPGHALHRELVLLSEAGVPSDALLVDATAGAARWLGIDDRTGTLEVGKEADLVVLRGDPLADIANVGDVSTVVTDGQVWTPEELLGRGGVSGR